MENEECPVSRNAALTLIKEAAHIERTVAGGHSEEVDDGEAPGKRWVLMSGWSV